MRWYNTARLPYQYAVDLLKLKTGGYTKAFCDASRDDCKTTANFPGPNSFSELTWDKVAAGLETIPKRWATDKSIERRNDLGYLRLNSALWYEDYKAIALALSVEDHAKVRPVLDAILGKNSKAWTKEQVTHSAREFFYGHKGETADGKPAALLEAEEALGHEVDKTYVVCVSSALSSAPCACVRACV